MNRADGPEDLLVLARRGRLSSGDERRFRVAVESSRELELLHAAGSGFDAANATPVGDGPRLEALVERTLATLDGEVEQRAMAGSSRRAVRSYRALAAGWFALGLLFGLPASFAMAKAWEYAERRWSGEQRSPRTDQALPARTTPGPSITMQAPAPVAEITKRAVSTSEAEVQQLKAAPMAAAHRRPTPASPTATKAIASVADANAPKSSASELFARANTARRSGDVELALTRYAELGREYPNSVEAQDAKLLVGKLLLSQRSPRAALRQFEAYAAPDLALETLWERAQALRKLKDPQEREVLSELVRRYPNSPYAAAAAKRLNEVSP